MKDNEKTQSKKGLGSKGIQNFADIPKCGGKAQPSQPPEGSGTGKWECVDDEWKWKEAV